MLHKEFLKSGFTGFVLSVSNRQHFIFAPEGSLVGCVILGDRTFGVGLESLKTMVWCHEYIIRCHTENLLDFPDDDATQWSDSWIPFEELTANNWLNLVKYC